MNTNGREHLLACLDAIERTHPDGFEHEVLVLDNASDDGSADAVRARGDANLRLIALERRSGKGENDSTLMREASGRYCLLLNEDSELRPGAAAALVAALDADPEAGAAGAQLLDSGGSPVPCAWRYPGVGTAVIGALFLHRLADGAEPRRRGQGGSTGRSRARCWSAARPPRPSATWTRTSSSTTTSATSAAASADAGRHTLYVPVAEAVHHDQLSTDLAAGLPRIVEFHRNRDLYMRKHREPAGALAVRALTAWSYAVRAAVAAVVPGRPARDLLGPCTAGTGAAAGPESARPCVSWLSLRRSGRPRRPPGSRPRPPAAPGSRR